MEKWLLKAILFLLCCTFIFFSCKDNKKTKDQEKILKLYAVNMLGKNEYILNKSSKNIQSFKDVLKTPLKLRQFKKIIKPVTEINLDSIVTPTVIKAWNKQIAHYRQIRWNKYKNGGLPLISRRDIPKYVTGGGFPKPDEKIITVHYLSTPIISHNVALLFVSQQSTPLSGSSGYLVYYKQNNQWRLVAENKIMMVR